MHASIACLLLCEDYVWVSLGNAMKAKQSTALLFPVAGSGGILMQLHGTDKGQRRTLRTPAVDNVTSPWKPRDKRMKMSRARTTPVLALPQDLAICSASASDNRPGAVQVEQ
jgi:hypothetical protein